MSIKAQVKERLANHDWWHMMSDSHSVWARGNNDMKEIKEMLSELSHTEASKLWQRYAPKRFGEYRRDPQNKVRREQ